MAMSKESRDSKTHGKLYSKHKKLKSIRGQIRGKNFIKGTKKTMNTVFMVFFLAEKEGFEPSHRLPQPTPLAGEPLQPYLGTSPNKNCSVLYYS